MKHVLAMCILAVFMFSCNNKPLTSYSSANFELIELTKGVYAAIHKIGGKAISNAGVVDNGRETLIFDTFLSPDVARELEDVIGTLGLSPVKYVVNSHWHNDHIRGNQVFSSEVRIISTTRTAELIEEWEPGNLEYEKEYAPARRAYYDSLYRAFNGDTTSREYLHILMWLPYYEVLSESHKEVKTRLPDLFVDEKQEYSGPDRKVLLIPGGAGHTESDLVMYLPDDQILFSGDLVFNACHPYMAHGSVSGLKEWLDYLETLTIHSVVPGHGPIGSKEVLSAMKTYVLSLENLAEVMHSEGKTMDGTEHVSIPEAFESWWFERFFTSNVNFVYTELSGK